MCAMFRDWHYHPNPARHYTATITTPEVSRKAESIGVRSAGSSTSLVLRTHMRAWPPSYHLLKKSMRSFKSCHQLCQICFHSCSADTVSHEFRSKAKLSRFLTFQARGLVPGCQRLQREEADTSPACAEEMECSGCHSRCALQSRGRPYRKAARRPNRAFQSSLLEPHS